MYGNVILGLYIATQAEQHVFNTLKNAANVSSMWASRDQIKKDDFEMKL